MGARYILAPHWQYLYRYLFSPGFRSVLEQHCVRVLLCRQQCNFFSQGGNFG